MRFGRIGLSAGGLVLLGLVALLLAPSLVDQSALRRQVIAMAEQQIRRPVLIDRLHVHLLPWPGFEADGISLGDSTAKATPMLSVGRLAATIRILPLLSHRISFGRLAAEQVVLDLRRGADGTGNWQLGPATPTPAAPHAGGGSVPGGKASGGRGWQIDVASVHAGPADVTWAGRNERQRQIVRIDALDADGLLGNQPHLAASGEAHGSAFRLDGSFGALGSIPLRKAIPFRLLLSNGAGSAQLEGNASARQAAFMVHAHLIGRIPIDGTASVQLEPGPVLRLSAITIHAAASDLEGSAVLSDAGRLQLTAQLASTHLDLDQPAASMARKQPVATVPSTRALEPRADRVVPWEMLHAADADLQFHVVNLVSHGLSLTNLVTHVSLQHGLLRVDPLHADSPAGPISILLQADASKDPGVLQLSMQPAMLPAAWIAALAGRAGSAGIGLEGNIELAGQLVSQGQTVAALLAAMQGHLGASMVDGRIDRDPLLDALGQNGAIAMLRTGSTMQVRCLGLHGRLQDGSVVLDTIGLQTDRLSLDGSGRVGLVPRDLDLHLTAQLGVAGASAAVPVRVTGTLSHPRPQLDETAPGHRFALVLGGAPDPQVACDAMLRAGREGLPGPAAVVPVKHKRQGAADLLRSLGLLH